MLSSHTSYCQLLLSQSVGFMCVESHYLGRNLINNVTTCQISHFVRIPDVDLESRLRSLFHAHARLRLSFRAIRLRRRLHGRGSSEDRALLFHIGRVRCPDPAGCLGGRGEWSRATSGERLLLGRCWCLICGCWGGLGGRFSQWTERVDGIIDGFEFSGLCADLACASGASSSWYADGGRAV